MTHEQRATYAMMLPGYKAHLKFWDRACFVRFFNARGQVGALLSIQTASCKLLVPPFSHFALKMETAMFNRNVEKPAGDDKPKMGTRLATNRSEMLKSNIDCSSVY
jgi:hypothetical protein